MQQKWINKQEQGGGEKKDMKTTITKNYKIYKKKTPPPPPHRHKTKTKTKRKTKITTTKKKKKKKERKKKKKKKKSKEKKAKKKKKKKKQKQMQNKQTNKQSSQKKKKKKKKKREEKKKKLHAIYRIVNALINARQSKTNQKQTHTHMQRKENPLVFQSVKTVCCPQLLFRSVEKRTRTP